MASMTLSEKGMLKLISDDDLPSGITFGNGVQILSGNGSPNGVISAPAGSLFLRKDFDSVIPRSHVYVNTNGALSWSRILLG